MPFINFFMFNCIKYDISVQRDCSQHPLIVKTNSSDQCFHLPDTFIFIIHTLWSKDERKVLVVVAGTKKSEKFIEFRAFTTKYVKIFQNFVLKWKFKFYDVRVLWNCYEQWVSYMLWIAHWMTLVKEISFIINCWVHDGSNQAQDQSGLMPP